MGPRKKVDIASLRSMPREERLRLLIESVAECGGKPESLNGETFRRLWEKRRRGSAIVLTPPIYWGSIPLALTAAPHFATSSFTNLAR